MTPAASPKVAAPAFVVPAHPTVPGHPAGLMARYVADGEPLWTEGPWKSLVNTARKGDWRVRLFAARGFTIDTRGHVGPLVDTVSLRCWHTHLAGEVYSTDRAVALWQRHTWPVLGRARRGEEDETRAEGRGEGRASSAGKTWLWHPPMAAPELEQVEPPPSAWKAWHPPLVAPALIERDPLMIKWTFDGGWIWTAGSPIVAATSTDVREWLKKHW